MTQIAQSSSKRILIFAGAASKPATEEAIKIFQEKTGFAVDVIFGGSGFVLSQMKLTKKGDLYFPWLFGLHGDGEERRSCIS